MKPFFKIAMLSTMTVLLTLPSAVFASDKPMTYAEFLAADVDTMVAVETYVQAKQSWWDNTATVYTQTPEGAYFCYNIDCSEEDYDKLVEGQKILVTGYKSEWSGEIEIVDATFELLDGDTYIADPIDVADLLDSEELSYFMNQKVAFTGMTVESSMSTEGEEAAYLYNWDGSGEDGDDLYFNVSKDGRTYSFTVESYLCGAETEVYKAVKQLNIGDEIDLEGFLYWYEGPNPHITKIADAGTMKAEVADVETMRRYESADSTVEPVLEDEEQISSSENISEDTELSETESVPELPQTEAIETSSEPTESENTPHFKKFFWGDSKETVEAVEGEPDLTGAPTGYSNAEYIVYEDRSLAGKDAVLGYYFTDDQFFEARYFVTESHSVDQEYINDFDDIVDVISKRYGNPSLEYPQWDSDRHEEYYADDKGSALVYGYYSLSTWWNLDNGTLIHASMSSDNYDVTFSVSFSSTEIEPGDADYSDDF